jgi:hypothetical protein
LKESIEAAMCIFTLTEFHAMDKRENLNKIAGYFQTGRGYQNESGYEFSLRDHGAIDSAARIEVVFENIEERLLDMIDGCDIVVGCVAWFTNFKILKAMKRCEFVNVVVQKEDYLRNDTTHPDKDWAKRLRSAYLDLRGKGYSMNVPDVSIDHPHYNSVVQRCCVAMDGQWTQGESSVRCIGYETKDKNRTPKMHHKFLVFCKSDPDVDMIPVAVWTGSFNISDNATRSRENALIIQSYAIAHAYLAEWAQLWALSEPLDWTAAIPERSVLYVGT